MFFCSTLYLNSVQQFIPCFLSTGFSGFQIGVFTQFIVQSNHSLFCTDIGRGCLSMYFRAFFKLDISTITFACSLLFFREDFIFLIFPYAVIFKCFIELHNEITAECLGIIYKTLVIHPTGYLSLGGIYFDFTHICISVDHQIGISGRRIGKTQMHAAGSRCHFGGNAIIQCYFIIMRLGNFIVMTKFRRPFILINN